MAVLLVLFLARVLGQILAATLAPPWLPPMRRWYSGLMPYRYLLPTQIVFLVVMTAMTLSVARESAPLGVAAPAVGTVDHLGELRLRARHGGAVGPLRTHAAGTAGRAHPDRLSLRARGLSVHLRPLRLTR